MEQQKIYLRLLALLFVLSACSTNSMAQVETQNPSFPFWKIKGNSSIDTSQYFLGTTDANYLTFRTNNIRRVTIDTGGRVGIGTTVPSLSGMLEVTNTSNGNPTFIATNYGNPNEFWFRRSGGSIGSPTLIGSAGSLGRIDGRGYDGGAYVNAARIELLVDSTSGNGSMSGRIIFATNPTASTATPVERMRINRNGLVGINSTPVTYLDVNGDLALREGTLTLVNGDNNNVVTSNNPFPAGKSFYRVTGPTADFNITGIAGGQDGRILILFNDASDTMNIVNLSASSNPTNKINTTGNTLAIPVKGSATLQYDNANSRWTVTGYNNGNFGTVSSGTNWLLNGNSGTSSATNFLGTTDAVDLVFKINNEKSGLLENNVTGNTYFGHKAGSSFAGTSSNAVFGNRTLEGWTSGNQNSVFGAEAGAYNLGNNGSNHSIFGYRAGYHVLSISGISAFGTEAGTTNESGLFNSYFGYRAGYKNKSGYNNSFFGDSSGLQLDVTGAGSPVNQNTFIGAKAGLYVTNGSDNTFTGYKTGTFQTGDGNTLLGSQASSGYNNFTGLNGVTAVGYRAGFYNQSDKTTFVGYMAGSNNNTATSNTMVGYVAGLNSEGSENTFIGDSAGYFGDLDIYQDVFVGSKAGATIQTGYKNTAIGYWAMANYYNPGATVYYTTALGSEAGEESNGASNSTYVGYRSGYNASSSSENSMVGSESGSFLFSSNRNSLLGVKAAKNMATANNNVIIGYQAASQITTSTDNVIIGANAAGNTFGSSNKSVLVGANMGTISAFYQSVAIGENIASPAGTFITLLGNGANVSGSLTNATAVGANSIVSQSNAVILGNSADVGIGTSTPARKLHVGGTASGVRIGGLATGGSFITTPSATTDKIMYADANGDIRAYTNGTSGQTLTISAAGIPVWTSANSYAWLTTGNASTVDGTNFIGTTDNIPLTIKVNNQKSGRIDNSNHNASFGYESMRSITSATNLTVAGDSAAYSLTTGTDNTAYGARALRRNVTGTNNVAIGRSSLHFTTGSHLVAVGSYAMYNATSTTGSTAIGDSALYNTTSGNLNSAFGYGALERNTTGYNNTAEGFHALYFNTTGYNNNAAGVEALVFNSTGYDNCAYGFGSMYTNTTGNDNTALGFYSLTNNLSGDSNTALGSFALYGATNSTGSSNIGIGIAAGRNISTGSNNIFIGTYAGRQISTGSGNVAIGLSSIQQNTSGNYNSTLGTKALFNNTSGNYNLAFGDSSLYQNTTSSNSVAVGSYALLNSTGTSNTAAGHQALLTNTSGTYNTALGYTADASSGNLINATALGAFARVDASNSLVLGSVSGVNGAAATVNVGIGVNAPATRLEINGALTLEAAFAVNANSDLFAVPVGNQSYIRINSDNATGTNRTISLGAGLATGQVLIVECTAGGNQIEFLGGTGNVQTGGSIIMDGNDIATFVWNGTFWLMMSVHAN